MAIGLISPTAHRSLVVSIKHSVGYANDPDHDCVNINFGVLHVFAVILLPRAHAQQGVE